MNDSYEELIQDDEEELVSEPRWWSPSALLTSGASAISAFTLAVAGTLGFVGYPVAEALVGLPEGPGAIRDRAIANGIIVLLLLLGAFWLSQRVFLDGDDETPSWALHLAGSAVVIAAIGALLSTVTIIASLLDSSDFTRMGP